MTRNNNTAKKPHVDTSEDREYGFTQDDTTAPRDPVADFLEDICDVDTPDLSAVFEEENIDRLVDLTQAEYAQVADGLKKIFGSAIDLRRLRGTVSKLRAEEEYLYALAELPTGDLPPIDVTELPLRQSSQLALNALLAANNPPTLFARDGAIVRVVEDEKRRPRIQILDVDLLRGHLARAAEFFKQIGRRLLPIAPPDDVVRDVLCMHVNSFPPISGITETPIVRPDGTIAETQGYDAATHLYLKFAPGFKMPKIPKKPTQEQARKAIRSLDEVIGDFPFKEPADKANELALLLTLVMRPAIAGIVPMAHLDAPMAGTGKGLLASLNTIIATGMEAATDTAPTSEAEWEKLIMATLGDGATIFLLDNVRGMLLSSKLEAMLTADRVTGRILGLGRKGTYDNRLTCMVTGNNMQLGADLPRRVYQIRLDAETSAPEDRENFKHSEPKTWLKTHRGAFLAAILTVIRAWYAAGKPMPEKPVTPMGSYEEWTRTLSGILNYCGVAGFLGNRERQKERSVPDRSEWEQFLSAWDEKCADMPVKCSEIEDFAKNDPEFAAKLPPSLRKSLDESMSQFRSSSFTLALSKALGYKADARFGPENIHLERLYDSHKKTVEWSVRKDKVAPTDTPSEGDLRGLRGFAGVVSNAEAGEQNIVSETIYSVGGRAVRETPAYPRNTRKSENDPIPHFPEDEGLSLEYDENGLVLSKGNQGYSDTLKVPCDICKVVNWATNWQNPKEGKYACAHCRQWATAA
jgi:hypothetical protein